MSGLLQMRKNPFYILASPFVLTFAIYIPTFSIYLIMSPTLFEAWYNAPKVLSSPWQTIYFFSILLVFGIGGYLGSHLLPKAKSRQRTSVGIVPRWYLRGGMVVAMFAYLVWFALGIKRAGGIGSLFSIYLIKPFYVKSVILKTAPGITTLTQVAVAAIPLLICYHRLARVDLVLIGVILLFGILRAFVFSERLAILELAVPVAFLMLSLKRFSWVKAFYYIVIFIILAISLFIISESFRSFAHKEWSSIEALFRAGTVRFLGYYMTSVNNALFFINNYAFASPLYFAFQAIWRFPGLRGVYTSLTGSKPIHAPQVLYYYGMNPEFNTATTIGSWVVDFGLLGTFIVALFFGFFSGALYRLASQNRFIAALYSVWLVGLLEFMRISYFTSTRLFPAYLFFTGGLLLAPRVKQTGSKRLIGE